MKKIALFPGTFDPITVGHTDVLHRALPLFDEIIIAIGTNAKKQCQYSIEQRENWIKDIFKAEPKIQVKRYNGLTVDFCKNVNAQYIVRGLRSTLDFEYEEQILQINRSIAPLIETIFIISGHEFSSISSSVVRDIINYKGDYTKFVPKEVIL